MSRSGIVVWLFAFNVFCTYAQPVVDGPYADAYLKGFACAPSAFDTLADATTACDVCATCGGIVLSNGKYETRKEDVLRPSPSGEQAWLVDPVATSFTFGSVITDTWLGGFACEETFPFYDIANAKKACGNCGSDCGGITCNQAGDECTIRKGTTGQTSYTGESSYLVSDDTCNHLVGILGPTVTGTGNQNAYGQMDVWIAPDQESVTVRVEWHNSSTPIKGMHIHDSFLHLKALLICTEVVTGNVVTGVCEGTYARGSRKVGYIPWDRFISELKAEVGYYGLLHSSSNANGEIIGMLFCDGIQKAVALGPCNPYQCIPEYLECASDNVCVAVSTLYSFDLCHMDPGLSFELTTPADECYSMLSESRDQPSLQYLRNLVACILCCGDQTCKDTNTVTG